MERINRDESEAFPRLSSILSELEKTRDLLKRVNTRNGNLERYSAIKKEIQELGWSGICAKYHPDVNIDDPAALELFQLYKFVYSTMEQTT